jgi:nucleoside recognition membrane protein YjiH
MQKGAVEVRLTKESIPKWCVLLPSMLGVVLFMVPVFSHGTPTTMIALLATELRQFLSHDLLAWMTVMMVVVAVFSLYARFSPPKWVVSSTFWQPLFCLSLPWLLVRIMGAFFSVITFFQIGPDAIWSVNTGALLFDLLSYLFCIFIFAGLFLPLLLNFGLMEFIGVLLSQTMRKVFNLPGKSAVGCLAAWFGDGSIGVLLTSKQYEEKIYTQREAAVIGSNFSAVSLTFSLVVLSQVKLESMFFMFYLTVCIAGFIAAIVIPKLYPLRQKLDVYIDGTPQTAEQKKEAAVPEGYSTWQYAYQCAVTRAMQENSLVRIVQEGLKNVIEMILGVLPSVMAVGTIATMIASYTPIFDYMGLPFVYLLNWLQIPEATEASKTIMVGFADMLIPSILASSIESEMTRFVIAALSVTQLIYLSEIGALLLSSAIPLTLFELFIIFILRTLVCLPVISLIAHLVF